VDPDEFTTGRQDCLTTKEATTATWTQLPPALAVAVRQSAAVNDDSIDIELLLWKTNAQRSMI
jgi:hypothetical protein